MTAPTVDRYQDPRHIARLGFLMGLGWDAKRIADDRVLAGSAVNVKKQAQTLGLEFRGPVDSPWALSSCANAKFDVAASKRSITRAALIRRILLIVAEESSLIDNILDDEDEIIAKPSPSQQKGKRDAAIAI